MLKPEIMFTMEFLCLYNYPSRIKTVCNEHSAAKNVIDTVQNMSQTPTS